jgi:hypothetical protein
MARHPNSYGRANADADADHADTDAGYGNAGADAHANTRSHGEFHGRAVPDPIRHSDDHADRDSRGADTDGHLHADQHTSPCGNADADGYPCAYRSADGDDGAAYCHTGGDLYHTSHCDIHSQPISDANKRERPLDRQPNRFCGIIGPTSTSRLD